MHRIPVFDKESLTDKYMNGISVDILVTYSIFLQDQIYIISSEKK